jgi:hypothetical protein
MESKLELLSPWIEPRSPENLARELRTEVVPGHPLFGKSVEALALATDRDDVLFAIHEDGGVRYAVVHLTWRGKAEIDAKWPRTKLFDSLESWIEWMRDDHITYTWGEKSPESPEQS